VSGNQLASLPAEIAMPDGSPKQQYDYAFDFLKRNDYVRGEAALREFLKRHPKDALAGNAQYWLGETFYVRGNYQQAAVEFMAGYQTFPKNAKSPDSLFKLGLSLEKLNQNEGACTAFGRITKDYPDASDQVRNATKAERTKLKCK
jgi:tol-pal system protein YbgF